jgi:bile acid:Na+ symporter, BASS family
MRLLTTVFQVLVAVVVPLAGYAAGLRAPRKEALWLWKRPGLLARSLLAILVIIPLFAVFTLMRAPLEPAVRGGVFLAILAVGIGPIAAMKRINAEEARFELGLVVTLLLVSIAFTPAALALFGAQSGHHVPLGAGQVAQVVFTRALIPLALGVATSRLWPRFAARLARWEVMVVNGGTLVLVLLAVAGTWRQLAGVGGAGWFTCALVASMAVLVGHLLGGPSPATRPVLAAFGALRFPALALLLASVAPGGRAMIPAVVVYVLVSTLIVTIYGAVWAAVRRRVGASASRPAPVPS